MCLIKGISAENAWSHSHNYTHSHLGAARCNNNLLLLATEQIHCRSAMLKGTSVVGVVGGFILILHPDFLAGLGPATFYHALGYLCPTNLCPLISILGQQA